MIDIGLLASIALVFVVPGVFVRAWPAWAVPTGVYDAAAGALGVGLVVGRMSAVALDDPNSLASVSDLIVIRSGVEFWPAVAAGLVWLGWRSRQESVPVALRLAALSAPGLVAWASYEGACLLREGCVGPVTNVGLRPDGLVQRMLPMGLLVAAAAVCAAAVTRRLHRSGMPHAQVVVLTLALIALIRSVASVWLPRVSTGLTRQHRTSILVAACTTLVFVALRARQRRALIMVNM